jgi:NADPH-dependent 2,4-dienoyl-CoA reductase/sulfur reductase-like enzyme/rhodanese-related sulfurtransferase
MKILIIGGVAGGASCAARARRLSEEAEIIIFDRGPYVSFANCGLPYYVGNVIKEEAKLLVATPELFKQRFNIEVRLESEVVRIDRKNKEIEIKELKTGRFYRESYDALVLSPGAAPIRPPLPGIDLPGIFALRTIPDSRKIIDWIKKNRVKRALIVGGGFIGLEMAENLANFGIQVSIMEMLPQVMPPLDPEMVIPVHEHLKEKGVSLYLGDAVAGFQKGKNGSIVVSSKSGKNHEAELVLLAIGVRPETRLAADAGLEIGQRGGLRVDEHMKTKDPHIWAVGDAVEVRDYVTGESITVPLAGPANRQGRIAADHIFGRPSKFRGIQATAVCKVFDLIIASTGASEKTLKRLGRTFEKIYLHPGNHASYYPGASPIYMKLIFSPDDGLVLGSQAVGRDGVEKRIDVIAMAIQKRATVYDLEEAELCYAPQFGAAKDPVNIAGMIATNALRGDATLGRWEDLNKAGAFLLDVRDPEEFAQGHVEGAVNIPLHELRAQMPALPKDRELWVYCGVGQRSYYATRALMLNGFKVRNLSGGFQTYEALKANYESIPS